VEQLELAALLVELVVVEAEVEVLHLQQQTLLDLQVLMVELVARRVLTVVMRLLLLPQSPDLVVQAVAVGEAVDYWQLPVRLVEMVLQVPQEQMDN
jgi:hypothetical protein